MGSVDDSEDIGNGRRFGKATWVIVGGIAALAIAFAAVAVYGSTIMQGADDATGPSSETARESATSGPGHNTTSSTAPQSEMNTSTQGDGFENQMPDSELTSGRETSGTPGPQTVQNLTEIP